MDLLRSGTLAALLLVLPGAAGCQSLFSKARIESPEEAAISKSVKARLAAEKTVNLTSVEVETNSGRNQQRHGLPERCRNLFGR